MFIGIPKKQPIWILEEDVFDEIETQKLGKAITDAGLTYYTINKDFCITGIDGVELQNKRCSLKDSLLVTSKFKRNPFVFRGSLRSCRYFNKHYKHVPGTFHKDFNIFNYTYWSSRIDRDFLLNGYSKLCTLSNLKTIANSSDRLFIKSDKCGLIPGQLFSKNAVLDLIEESGLPQETLFVVNDALDIGCEYRVLIVNTKIVSSSQYRNAKGEIDLHSPIDLCSDTESLDFICRVISALQENFDKIYTLDICKNFDYYVVEINSFSAASLYNMNMDNVVAAISNEAVKEWEEYY